MITDFKFLTKNNELFKFTPFVQNDVNNMVEYFNQVAFGSVEESVKTFENGTYFYIDEMIGSFTIGGIRNDERLIIRGQITYHHHEWKMSIKIDDGRCIKIEINFNPTVR